MRIQKLTSIFLLFPILFVNVSLPVARANEEKKAEILWFPLANYQAPRQTYNDDNDDGIRNHNGEDYTSEGMEVYAPISGKVIASENNMSGQFCDTADDVRANGNYIKIQDDSGVYTVTLAHLKQGSVEIYDGTVEAGDLIGRTGNTGYTFTKETTQNADLDGDGIIRDNWICGYGYGHHLHVGLKVNGTLVDPNDYWIRNTEDIPVKAETIPRDSSSTSTSCPVPDATASFYIGEVGNTYKHTNDTTDPDATWKGVLALEASLSGSEVTFTVSKEKSCSNSNYYNQQDCEDAGETWIDYFKTSGKMYLNVGSYSSYGSMYRGKEIDVITGNTSITFPVDDQTSHEWCTYSKDYYARYEAEDVDGIDGGYTVVGPITIEQIPALGRVANDDADYDGLTDAAETSLHKTDLNDYDTDDDGLSDGFEVENELDPLLIDTDSDGTSDSEEIPPDYNDEESDSSESSDSGSDSSELSTDNDSDGDGLEDWKEEAFGLDPYDTDTDNDGLSDGYEVEHGESPNLADGDGDGLLDGEEIALGTMTGYYDSDYDGLWDGDEVDDHNTDPLVADTDGDGLSDGDEVENGYDPTDTDMDDDGMLDGVDTYPLIPVGEIEVIFNDDDSTTSGFGSAIVVDGDVVVIGAERQNTTNIWDYGNLGIVYVYRWDGTLWNLEAELIPSDESYSQAAYDFGTRLAIDGNVIVVGAPGDHYGSGDSPGNAGSVYVYRYDDSTKMWKEEVKLTSNNPQENEHFGYSVDVDGDVIAVGANGYNNQIGCSGRPAAYLGAISIFRYNQTSKAWPQETKITGTDDNFDCTAELDFTDPELALDDNTLLIGDSNYRTGAAVHVYQYASTWQYLQTLTADDGAASFGSAVSLDGDTSVIGAPNDGKKAPVSLYDSGDDVGSAYVFVRDQDDSNWVQQAKLTASDGLSEDRFGQDVAIDGDVIVVGTSNDYTSLHGYNIGKAYTFRWNGTSWEEEEKITPEGEENNRGFGQKVAVSGELVLIGWLQNEETYVYSRPDPDDDNDGLMDEDEVAYGTDPLSGDTDEDGLNDGDELIQGLNPLDSDSDDDGLLDGEEIVRGTNARDADSDDDGLKDGAEVSMYHSDPIDFDSDDDGLPDSIRSASLELDEYTPDPTEETNLAYTGRFTMTAIEGIPVTLEGVQYSIAEAGIDWTEAQASDDGFDSEAEEFSFQTGELSDGIYTVLVRSHVRLNGMSYYSSSVSDTVTIIDNSTYIVTKTVDTNDGSCDSDCSLREAIIAANTNTTEPSVTINFNIPTTDSGCDGSTGVCTLSPTSALPSLTRNGITMNGYSQPGASPNTSDFPLGLNTNLKIVLHGSSAGTNISGLKITSSNNTIKGLVINNFTGQGIYIYSGSGNKIQGCFIGTDVTGLMAQGNNYSGIFVPTSGSGTILGIDGDGENEAAERNLISGNKKYSGIVVSNGTGTVIAGNIIGMDANLANALANGLHGIYISQGTNRIGTNADGISDDLEGNIIAHNKSSGIFLSLQTMGTQIRQNSLYNNGGAGITLFNYKSYTPNNKKASPVIASATSSSSSVIISGTATSGDTIELFVASSDSEGETYVESATTDSSGKWTVTTTLSLVPMNTNVVATATDSTNGTSAFSTTFTIQ